MNEEEFDEKDYSTALISGGDTGVRAAAKGFGALGFRTNSDRVVEIAFGSLDFSRESSFSALRCAHMSRHASQYLEGRQTWLPLLHTVSMFRFYGPREDKGAKGGSLTSSQLNFELLEAFGRGEWSRATGIAKEMAQRGDNEELLSALRSESIRRHSLKSLAYITWNAVRCAASSETELLSRAIVPAILAIASEEVSSSYDVSRRCIASERFRVHNLVDNDQIPPEKEEKRLLESIRSGIPGLAVQILGKQLKEGVSLRHLMQLVSVETLNQSLNSANKMQLEAQIETLFSMIEANRSQDWSSGNAVLELLVALVETASASSEPGYRRKGEAEGKIEDAIEQMEKGRPNQLMIHINGLKNSQEIAKTTSKIVLSSLKCDPETVTEHPFTHCTSAIHIGSSSGEQAHIKIALRECADLIAFRMKNRKTCSQTIMETTKNRDSG